MQRRLIEARNRAEMEQLEAETQATTRRLRAPADAEETRLRADADAEPSQPRTNAAIRDLEERRRVLTEAGIRFGCCACWSLTLCATSPIRQRRACTSNFSGCVEG